MVKNYVEVTLGFGFPGAMRKARQIPSWYLWLRTTVRSWNPIYPWVFRGYRSTTVSQILILVMESLNPGQKTSELGF